MIYSFLSDEAFAVTNAQATVMSVNEIQTYKLGILDDNLLNYFDNHTVITDPVGSRRAVNRTTRQSVDAYTGGSIIVRGSGRMFFNLDANKLGLDSSVERAFMNSITADVDDDNDSVLNEKAIRRAALFNIVEAIFYSRDRNSHINNVDAIEALFSAGSGSTYSGYVSESLKVSSTVARGAYRYVSDSVTDPVSSTELEFYTWCEFAFKFGNTEAETVIIRVWLSTEEFKKNYPYSTITDVIYPCKPEWILNPSQYGSEMKAVLMSSNYKDTSLDSAISSRDHSGISVYKTRYVHDLVTTDALMGFVVMYKGAAPSSASMRQAIKDRLLSEINPITGSQLADETEWKKVLPDLFVDSGFYIFPCYYQRMKNNGITIEQNISNYKTMFERLKLIFTGNEFTEQELFDYAEIIQAPGHGMYMIAMPVSIGDSNKYKSILAIHPTYQPMDSVGSVVEYRKTNDVKFANKEYFIQNPLIDYEFMLVRFGEGQDYNIGDTIPTDRDFYECIVVRDKDQWNSMTSTTKSFAWSLARCIAACINKTISLDDSEFTVEQMGSGVTREYYSFVSNSTEYHVLTATGAIGVFDRETSVTGVEEHVPGYIH